MEHTAIPGDTHGVSMIDKRGSHSVVKIEVALSTLSPPSDTITARYSLGDGIHLLESLHNRNYSNDKRQQRARKLSVLLVLALYTRGSEHVMKIILI